MTLVAHFQAHEKRPAFSTKAENAAGRRGGYGAGCRGVVTLWVEGSSVCVTAAPLSLSGLSTEQSPGAGGIHYRIYQGYGGPGHKSCSYLHYDEGINLIS